jgi:hypothetical protein
MRVLREEQREMWAHLKRLEAGLAPSTHVNVEDAFGPSPLTAEQCQKLVSMLRQVQRQTGIPLRELEAEVADHCGADHLSAIPQSAWTEAVAWVCRKLGFQ